MEKERQHALEMAKKENEEKAESSEKS